LTSGVKASSLKLRLIGGAHSGQVDSLLEIQITSAGVEIQDCLLPTAWR
jgi:hypothetical protein